MFCSVGVGLPLAVVSDGGRSRIHSCNLGMLCRTRTCPCFCPARFSKRVCPWCCQTREWTSHLHCDLSWALCLPSPPSLSRPHDHCSPCDCPWRSVLAAHFTLAVNQDGPLLHALPRISQEFWLVFTPVTRGLPALLGASSPETPSCLPVVMDDWTCVCVFDAVPQPSPGKTSR